MILMTKNTRDYLFVFVVTEPDFKNPQLFLLLSGIFSVVKDWFSSGVVMECFVESLSHIPMMKFIEKLGSGMSNNMLSKGCLFFVILWIVVFLQHGVNCKLETTMCFTRPD
jgi:uncharacterized membrane protein YGL010W